MQKKSLIILLLLMCSLLRVQGQPKGDYEGAIYILGNKLDITMHLHNNPFGGTLDVPVQGAYSLPFAQALSVEDSIYLLVDTGMTRFSFAGRYYPEGDSIAGTFTQGNYQGNFKVSPPGAETTAWIDREVRFNNDSITLAGTLSLPDTTEKHPAVILISGSGQQNRDENIYGFKVFSELARIFINEGFAVLRYDDRGAGNSDSGDLESATTATYAQDVEAAYNFLAMHSHVRADSIGLMGHSEGGLIAGKVAPKELPAFVILMASPAMRGDSLLLAQSRAILEAMGKPDSTIQEAVQANRKIYSAVQRKNPDWKAIEEDLTATLRKSTPQAAQTALPQQVKAQLKALKSDWFRYFLSYDPSSDLAAMSCPVLALYGQKDTQVPPRKNKNALEEIIRKQQKSNYTIKVIPEANHLFQKAETGAPTEYSKLDKNFAEAFTQKLTEWLQGL